MADSMSVTGSTQGIDISRWKKLTPQEIMKEESKGEDIPSEIVNWAQQMAAFSKIPDDVTYEEVDGDTGLDALDKLGISPEEAGLVETQNATPPDKTETPDAIKDPAAVEENPPEENNIFMNPTPGQAAEAPNNEGNKQPEKTDESLTIADSALVTDPEEIRKRKFKLGLA